MTTPLKHLSNIEKELEIMELHRHIDRPDLFIGMSDLKRELDKFKGIFLRQIEDYGGPQRSI